MTPPSLGLTKTENIVFATPKVPALPETNSEFTN